MRTEFKIEKLPSIQDRQSEIALQMASVVFIVCDYYEIPVEYVRQQNRHRQYVKPRQIIMYFLMQIDGVGLKKCGMYMGGFDHTTVVHSRNLVNDLIETDANYRKEIEDIIKLLNANLKNTAA